LQAHFEKFAPSVVVGDRVGRDQPHFKTKQTAPSPGVAAAAAAAAEPGVTARPGARKGLFVKVAAKQLGQIMEHDD